MPKWQLDGFTGRGFRRGQSLNSNGDVRGACSPFCGAAGEQSRQFVEVLVDEAIGGQDWRLRLHWACCGEFCGAGCRAGDNNAVATSTLGLEKSIVGELEQEIALVCGFLESGHAN